MVEGLARLEASGAANVLVVAHKGIVRTIAEHLLGEALAEGEPPLADRVSLTRRGGTWQRGRRSSDPEGLDEAAA